MYQLAEKQSENFFNSTTMFRFRDAKVTKEIFYATKKVIKIWDVNADNIFISKLVKTKTSSKYLIGY